MGAPTKQGSLRVNRAYLIARLTGICCWIKVTKLVKDAGASDPIVSRARCWI